MNTTYCYIRHDENEPRFQFSVYLKGSLWTEEKKKKVLTWIKLNTSMRRLPLFTDDEDTPLVLSFHHDATGRNLRNDNGFTSNISVIGKNLLDYAVVYEEDGEELRLLYHPLTVLPNIFNIMEEHMWLKGLQSTYQQQPRPVDIFKSVDNPYIISRIDEISGLFPYLLTSWLIIKVDYTFSVPTLLFNDEDHDSHYNYVPATKHGVSTFIKIKKALHPDWESRLVEAVKSATLIIPMCDLEAIEDRE